MSSKQLNNMHFIQANTASVEGNSSNPAIQTSQANAHVCHHFHHTGWSAEDAKKALPSSDCGERWERRFPRTLGAATAAAVGGYGCGCGENRDHENEVCKEREKSYTRVMQRNPGAYPQPVRHRVKLAILAKL
ncbi:hypothetical protein BG006_010059 [Podila minutissima]|uniref:Uncharacterized protein n=1 Tax=Podila minutissima TaxID=64525 RepID=A0A9P5SDW8_9FUNG|nr:hypothetical protein BG006_010059 [Podila minutissima]